MRELLGLVVAVVLAVGINAVHAAVGPGQSAPDFVLADLDGAPRRLQDYRGKLVVLEWFNSACPFVGKHYGSGNMQRLQTAYTAQGVIWFTINSTAAEHNNYRDAESSRTILDAWTAAPSAYLLDPEGIVGRQYGARTTPHMFVIDPAGTVIYAGGIDDTPSTSRSDIAGAKNYVAAALDDALAGRKVGTAFAPPYGCAIKYAE